MTSCKKIFKGLHSAENKRDTEKRDNLCWSQDRGEVQKSCNVCMCGFLIYVLFVSIHRLVTTYRRYPTCIIIREK